MELVNSKLLGNIFLLVLTLFLFFPQAGLALEGENAITGAVSGEMDYAPVNGNENGYSLSASRQVYLQSESIELSLHDAEGNILFGTFPQFELWLTKGDEKRKYMGDLAFPLVFAIENQGSYTLTLKETNGRTIDEISVMVAQAQIISDGGYDDSMAENITGIVSDIINSMNQDSEVSNCQGISVNISKENIFVGEEIQIQMSGFSGSGFESAELKITHGESTYRFLGYSEFSRFTAPEEGEYTVSAACRGTVVSETKFYARQEVPLVVEVREKEIRIKGSDGATKKISMKVFEEDSNNDETGLIRGLIGTPEVKNAHAEIDLSSQTGMGESTLKLNNFSSADINSVEILVEPLDEQKYIINGDIPMHSFAMDLSNLDFSGGTFSSVAKGNALWKCAEWDYASQKCLGSWSKLMGIVPGTPYSFEVSQSDPGYAETGVATINTRKSYYIPGEPVDIYAAVLDTKGYLVSNASVEITVENPDGDLQALSTALGHVVEEEKGIYSTIFSNTEVEGTYLISVHAKGENVDYNMSSSFEVAHDYDFEIIRKTPLSTDPFKETLYSEINIQPRVIVESYNFTEIVPIELEVLSADGAEIIKDLAQNKTFIKWSGLVGNTTVSYTAQPPLKTPNLLRLGKAYVEYYLGGISKIFSEIREWVLAIDPEVPTDDGLVVYGNSTSPILKYRNWTSDELLSEQLGPSSGTDVVVWIKLRCQKDMPVCILGITNWDGRLFFSAFNTNTWQWSINQTLCTDSYNELWSWDLDCEGNSNNCIIAYENRSGTTAVSNNHDFMYRVWNGSAISQEYSATVTGGEDRRFNWIKLYPQKGTNVMGIALQNDFGGTGGTPAIYGGAWNGTAFGTWQTFTTNGPSTGNGRTQYRHFDCGWEGGFGRLICAYGQDGINSIFGYRYNGTAWTDLGRFYNGTSEVLQVAVCGQEPTSNFNHSYVGIMDCDTLADLDGGIWNGTKFSKSVASDAPAKNTNSECGSRQAQNQYGQNFQCVWENSGNQSLFVWVRNSADSFLTSGTYTVADKEFSMANWSTGVKITATGTSELRTSTLVSNPYNDKVFLVYTDAGRRGGCSLWRGSTWDGSGCNNATYFEASGGSPARHWLGFDWFRLRLEPYITIVRPAIILSSYSYYGVTPGGAQMSAYNGNASTLPPSSAYAPVNGTEFTAGNYYDVSQLDDSYTSSVFSAAITGQRAYQSYRFYIADPTVSMSQIKVMYEGYATRTTSLTPDDYNIYFYNFQTDTYVPFRTVYGGTGGDIYTETYLTESFGDYVRSNYFYVLVEAYTATGATVASRRSEMSTDYIALEVESTPVLSGVQRYNVSAIDEDGISGCRWQYYNMSFVNVSNKTEMSLAGAYYYNNTNTSFVADGNYYIYAFCNDTLGNTRNNSVKVRIDNTLPSVSLLNPLNASNFTVNYVLFSWNVTDLPNENMLCTLYVDNAVKDNSRVSPHAENVSKNVTGIADGSHTWYVKCTDNAGNINSSENRTFDTDTTAPVITPNYPPSAGAINYIPFDINFTVTDSHPIPNCSIYIDSVLNATLYNVTRSVQTNLTIQSMSEGLHRWNVSCYDSFGYRANSSLRNFTLDFGLPWISLGTADNAVFNGTPAQFNFTAYDLIDSSLMCNITANEEVVDANIVAPNGSLRIRNVSLIDGYKVWYVTCWDDAGNINVSESRTIRMIGGPSVIPQTPKSGTVNNGSEQNLTYYVQDGDGIANCTLYIDNVANQTNITSEINNFANNTFYVADLPEGLHYWNISCWDLSRMSGNSQTMNLSSDRSPPNVELWGPLAGQMLLAVPTRFNLTMTDAYSPNATCNITVDGNVSTVNRNFVVQNNTLTSKPETYSNGLHFWNVTCIDLGKNMNTSETRNFTVNVTMPITVTVTADKTVYQIPETAIINITTKNDTNKYIPANFTLDYIYTNTTYTDVPWWNINFPYRKPIYINETQGISRQGKPIPVNVTLPYGTISSCVEQLRVVEDDTLAEVAFNVISGDDVTYCYIAINATVSANAYNEQDYHVYYGNLSVPNPNYPNLTGQISIVSDTFAGAAIGAQWTEDAGWDVQANSPLAGNHAHIDGIVTLASMRLTNTQALKSYDVVNLSFTWALNLNWDAGEFIRYQYSNDSGLTWLTIDQLDGGIGAVTENVAVSINSTFTNDAFNIRFVATTNNANEDGGFDNFILSGYKSLQGNVTGSTGKEQIFLERITNATNSTGMTWYPYTTTGRILGNYSAAVLATSTNPKLRAGTGYDWFTIIEDNFGPSVVLIFPQNQMTNRTNSYNLTYNATDVANGVKNCSLFINGQYNQSNASTISNGAVNMFQMPSMAEGMYQWNVMCYDNLNNMGNSSASTFYLDDTPPSILPIEPDNIVLPSGTITFRFNATDNFDSLISCNISVDNFNKSRVLNANNGTITTTTISNITDGDHVWNITCVDNINNTGYSTTLNFSTATIPIVKHHFPPNGYGVNSTDIVLYYNLSSINVVNCSIFINGELNSTYNSSEIPYKANNGQNNFTFIGLPYGIYRWSVQCFDSNGFNGTDTERLFQLDNSVPQITLYAPENAQTLYTRNVNFYFNASDTVDDFLLCNMTIDGLQNRTNMSVASNANTTVLVSNMAMGAHNWSISCVDNTGFGVVSSRYNFTIESRVGVYLMSPPDYTFDRDGALTLGYLPQSTSGFNLGFCDLYIDNAYNQKKAAPTADITNYFNVSGLSEGNHTWYVNCTDNSAVVNFSSKRNIIIDSTAPGLATYYPDGNSFSSSTVFFNWTATDNVDPSMTCNVYVNGTLKAPGNIASPNGSVANATYFGIAEGTFNWYVICSDDAGNNVTSANKSFSVSENPVVNLGNPANATRTKNQNQTFYFTATDNSGVIQSCQFIFDGEVNQTRTGVSSGVQSQFNLTNIPNGVHNWTVNCTDPAGNVGINNSPRILIIDLDAPIIAMFEPSDGTYVGGNNVRFNWSATDYAGTNVACMLYIDNVRNLTLTQQSGTYFSPTVNNLTDGTHYWNVSCNDSLGNFDWGPTWSFIINQPDLYVDDSRVSFNNTNPNENQTITINANFTNLGGVPVVNALVEFWDGDPLAGGTLIGNSTGNIGFNSSKVFSVSWNITSGLHTIYVIGDPYNTTAELNESNNIATKNISILKSIITSPINATNASTSNLTIGFNLTDYTSGAINYVVYIGTNANQSGQVNDGEENTIDLTLPQGTSIIRVQAEDALGRKKNSSAIYVLIDWTAPTSTINTANLSWFNYTAPLISITSTDNTDTMINYTIYANGAFNIAGNISSGATLQVNLSELSDNMYEIIMEGFDDLGNIKNSTPKIIFVDTRKPWIALEYPAEGQNFTSKSVQLNYTPYDELGQTAYCNITLDGTIVNSQSGQMNVTKTFTATNLAEGTHYWNVTCRDQAYNTNTSETRSFNVFTPPSISLVNPQNNFWVNTSQNIFYFNVSDETGLENCSVLLNGTVAGTIASAQIINNGTNNISVSGMNGTYIWAIECYDNSSLNVYNVSANRTINVDIEKPKAVFYTQNDTWFNSSPIIYFNLSDNMDSSLNYTIFVNSSANQTGAANNGQNSSATLGGLGNGVYEILIQALDEAGNYYNSSPIIIGVDLVKPSITLLYPENDTNLTATSTDLNFTATDASGRNMVCNLTLDNTVVLQNRVVTSSEIVNYTASNLGGGYHYWNVTCVDIARNRNTSETRRFYILRSDIYVNASNIIFSNAEPVENETINITAAIENIGTTSAANFTVEFWEGLPGTGKKINGNVSINLTAGQSVNVTMPYTVSLGTKTIWIFADRANAVSEENESNNNASSYITVGLWHFAMGDTQDRLVTMDGSSDLLFDWEIDNSSESNIFVVDSDSNVNWMQLQALGRDTSNNTQFNDFAELDTALNSTGFADNVNATYTSGGAAAQTSAYTIYSRQINDVPVQNSTDNGNFKTGILWDYGDGGTGFNGTQDVVFVTKLENQMQGYEGQVHDYEIRIPATLRSYKGPALNRVNFYMEIR